MSDCSNKKLCITQNLTARNDMALFFFVYLSKQRNGCSSQQLLKYYKSYYEHSFTSSEFGPALTVFLKGYGNMFTKVKSLWIPLPRYQKRFQVKCLPPMDKHKSLMVKKSVQSLFVTIRNNITNRHCFICARHYKDPIQTMCSYCECYVDTQCLVANSCTECNNLICINCGDEKYTTECFCAKMICDSYCGSSIVHECVCCEARVCIQCENNCSLCYSPGCRDDGSNCICIACLVYCSQCDYDICKDCTINCCECDVLICMECCTKTCDSCERELCMECFDRCEFCTPCMVDDVRSKTKTSMGSRMQTYNFTDLSFVVQ